MFSPGPCKILLGYPLRILPKKCSNFQWKTQKTTCFLLISCNILIGYPLAILPDKFSIFQLKPQNSSAFPWFLHGFARLPPSNFALKILQLSMKNTEFAMYSLDFCTVLLGYPLAILHKKCSDVQWKTQKIPMFPWFQHFARLPPSNLAWKTKTKKIHCFLLVSVAFC